ncbi:MAG: putative silver efflux pump [Panacagrimonas sp.]|nr:efflux RND transporter permease subunit [Panacagrimonas sp.]MCC2659189.1 putative silver efflux pump [Panacagrimonas sp.]
MGFSTLVRWSLRRRLLVLGIALALLLAGTVQALRMPLDVLPELTRPTVSVHLEAPGLSATDAANRLAWPVESALAGLPDLVRLRSSSVAGLALVQAEFAWGTDAFRNRQFVAERIDAVRAQLPDGIEPRLGPLTSLMGEILLVALSAAAAHDGAALRHLRSDADWTLRPALLAIPGVSQVTVIGGPITQWEIQPDPERMKLFGVSLDQLLAALRGSGENRGGGIAEVGGREQHLRAVAAPFDPQDLAQVAVAHRTAGPVWLGQVAQVVEGARTARGSAGADGDPAVVLAIQKQPGADTLALTDAVEARLAQLDAGLAVGTRRTVLFRQADFIRASVGNVGDALVHAAVIVGVVLLLFLGGVRATAISLFAIPLSIAAAMLVLRWLGLSVNALTLGGLAIAVGELVDDAVVGVENVARRLREGGPGDGIERVGLATIEVRSGILQATLIIVAGFLPLFFLGGVEGRLFASLAVAYAAAILASLVVAATVTPALCALGFLGDARHVPRERAWIGRLRTRYLRVLARVIDHAPLLALACAALVAIAAIALATLPRTFLPTLNEGTLTVNLVLSPGLALEESARAGRMAERLMLELPEARSVGRRTGRAELDEHAEGPHYSELDVQLAPSKRSRAAIVADLQARLSAVPGHVSVGQPISHRIDHLLSGVRAPVAIKIYGEDEAVLERLATQVSDVLKDTPGLREAALETPGRVHETRLHIDTAMAAQYGLSPARVLDTVAALGAGMPLARIVDPPRSIDLVLRLPEERRDPRRLGEWLIDTPAGGPVPLSWIARIETVPVADRVTRENGRRHALLSAFADGDIDRAVGDLEQRLSALALPAGVEIRVEGQAAQARAATRTLLGLSLLALAIMAALLYARFRSPRAVLIVLGGIPLAWIGGVVALRLTSTPLSVASLVGFVTLAGIAARNSILKLSRYLDLEREAPHSTPRERVLRGSGERLSPVLMTSAVAAFSLLPLLVGAESPGKEILHPVAMVVFGGLFSSTLLDSFVTPTMWLRGPSGRLRIFENGMALERT